MVQAFVYQLRHYVYVVVKYRNVTAVEKFGRGEENSLGLFVYCMMIQTTEKKGAVCFCDRGGFKHKQSIQIIEEQSQQLHDQTECITLT